MTKSHQEIEKIMADKITDLYNEALRESEDGEEGIVMRSFFTLSVLALIHSSPNIHSLKKHLTDDLDMIFKKLPYAKTRHKLDDITIES